MKAYTNGKQSKILADILPLESADMYYAYDIPYAIPYKNGIGSEKPCWSLAALLDVIPKHIKDYNILRIDISDNDFAIWYDEVGFGVNNDLPDITADNEVDACVDMIVKLHELNLL